MCRVFYFCSLKEEIVLILNTSVQKGFSWTEERHKRVEERPEKSWHLATYTSSTSATRCPTYFCFVATITCCAWKAIVLARCHWTWCFKIEDASDTELLRYFLFVQSVFILRLGEGKWPRYLLGCCSPALVPKPAGQGESLLEMQIWGPLLQGLRLQVFSADLALRSSTVVLLYPAQMACMFLLSSRSVLDCVVPGASSTGLPRSEWSSCPLLCLALTASFTVPLYLTKLRALWKQRPLCLLQ